MEASDFALIMAAGCFDGANVFGAHRGKRDEMDLVAAFAEVAKPFVGVDVAAVCEVTNTHRKGTWHYSHRARRLFQGNLCNLWIKTTPGRRGAGDGGGRIRLCGVIA